MHLRASSEGAAPVAALSLRPVPDEGVRFRSEYSEIVVREEGTTRTLYFVDDQGRERIESRMDVVQPERLLVDYTRSMLVSYLFVPEPKRVLLIGVGAGSMVRFWQHHQPGLRVEAVDIDEVVLSVARDYFGTRQSDTVQLIVADGFDYLRRSERQYDVIYLDAFLKPSDTTDKTGVPKHLKTISTYKEMQTKLTPGGVVVVNLHYPTLDADVAELRQAFARGYLFEVPGTGNYILVGTADTSPITRGDLAERGHALDARLRAGFSFSQFAAQLMNR